MTVERVLEVRLATLDERYGKLRLERPALVAAVRRSIEREGLLHPLVVNQIQDGALVLLDGFKRLRVLRELGHEDVSVRVVHLDEAAAQAALFLYNAPHAGLSELEEAWIVRSLVRDCGLLQKLVAELLRRHKSWVCRRLLLAERLDPHIQEDMRLGLCSASAAREVARLPRGNQAPVAQAIRSHGLTSRQAAALVDRCLSSEPSALGALLADPLRFLVADPEPSEPRRKRDPRLSNDGEAVRRRLVDLEHAALGVCQILRQHPPAALAAGDLEVLGPISTPVQARSAEAASTLAGLVVAAQGHE